MNTRDREMERTAKSSPGRSPGAIILGIVLIILGIVAIAEPFFASVVIELFFGWLLIIGGFIQFIYAFQSRHTGGILLKILVSLLALAVGIFLVLNPLQGVVSLTLVLGIYFFVDGVLRVIAAFQTKPAPRWGWMLFSGIASIILGILIWSQWPFNAAWVIGLLVGIGLIINGLTIAVAGVAPQRTIP
ncbi:MAG: HdeD family acid-resistance protein [Synechococcales bacterium]|nr:HdeD family acid-resistance protein [Synechococcales bacterium]